MIKRSSNLIFQAYVSLLSSHSSFFLPVKISLTLSLCDKLSVFLIPLIKIQLEHRVWNILPNRRAFTYPFSFAPLLNQDLNKKPLLTPLAQKLPKPPLDNKQEHPVYTFCCFSPDPSPWGKARGTSRPGSSGLLRRLRRAGRTVSGSCQRGTNDFPCNSLFLGTGRRSNPMDRRVTENSSKLFTASCSWIRL